MKLSKNKKGFSAVEPIVIICIVGLVVAIGWMVWHSKHDVEKITDNTGKSSNSQATKKSTDTAVATKSFALNDKSVTFTTPARWTGEGIGCIKDAPKFSATQYLDSVSLLPGEKLRTVYGDGTEYFNVDVCVFGNSNNLSPQDWFTDASVGGIGEGIGSSSDQSSNDSINGNPAYYRKTISSANYHEVNYVISSKGKIVYVYARTYDVSDKMPGVGDFTKFEPAIKDLVTSIQVK